MSSFVDSLTVMEKELKSALPDIGGAALITDYSPDENGMWTDAFNQALRDNPVLRIPASDKPYMIDGSIIVPSYRTLYCDEGARILLAPGVRVLMLRNEHTHNGSFAPIDTSDRDHSISVIGGRWEESNTKRGGYGYTGRYDLQEDGGYDWQGVSTAMLFNNLDGLVLKNVTFRHTAGFSVQTGDLLNAVMEDIRFEKCFADGLHLNGASENIVIRNVSGQVGDDLVALNMYDWINSSVNYGPIRNIIAENLELSEDSPYKALRIEPGIYYYANGTPVDCSLEHALIKRVKGIMTFKMYYQTPGYKKGEEPERGDIGSGRDITFEDIDVDLAAPIDGMPDYLESRPLTGWFAAFEIGANFDDITFKNIDIILHDNYPLSRLVTVGPKSVRFDDYEVFDPYCSCRVGRMTLESIKVNGIPCADADKLVKTVVFDDLYPDMPSSGKGEIGEIVIS